MRKPRRASGEPTTSADEPRPLETASSDAAEELWNPDADADHAPTYRLQRAEPVKIDLAAVEPARAPQSDAAPPDAAAARPKRKRKRPRSSEAGADEHILTALWYPLSGHGPVLLGLYAFLLWLSANVPVPLLGPIVQLVVAAGLGLLFLETASFTLQRIPLGPRLPDLSWANLTAGLLGPVAMLIALAPMVVVVVLLTAAGAGQATVALAALALIAAGLAWLPMCLVALADLENERALNPALVVRGIARMPGAYFALVGTAAAVLLAPIGLLLWLRVTSLIVELASALWMLYVITAVMRATALLYRRRGIDLAAEDRPARG